MNDRPGPTWRERLERDLRRRPRLELEALLDRPDSALAWAAARELDRRDRETRRICAFIGANMARGCE